ncbi:MAG: L,D-transpeptidase [Actinobacteria bacterium]|nr:L,D-transpeptidase [Actinomycetota bacterium]
MLRSPHRLIASLLILVLVAAGCGRVSSGDNFRFSAGQLSPPKVEELAMANAPSTTADLTPPTATETQIATAKVPEVQVFTTKPGDPTAQPVAAKTGALPPIPRDGFASAGVRKTATGYAFDNPTYFKNPLVFVVLEGGGDYLRVMVPARPNGQTGWIKASDVTLSKTAYRMELNLAARYLKVFNGNELFAETTVVIGLNSSKTPLGKFYLNEKIQSENPNGVYGPWILSTNGYSEDLDQFDNGLPVIAFHGTNQPQLLGTQASNGCVRMPNEVDIKLYNSLPAGTPIEITA